MVIGFHVLCSGANRFNFIVIRFHFVFLFITFISF